jgi:hypothetical protein
VRDTRGAELKKRVSAPSRRNPGERVPGERVPCLSLPILRLRLPQLIPSCYFPRIENTASMILRNPACLVELNLFDRTCLGWREVYTFSQITCAPHGHSPLGEKPVSCTLWHKLLRISGLCPVDINRLALCACRRVLCDTVVDMTEAKMMTV